MIFVNVLLGIVEAILLVGILGEKSDNKRRDITNTFIIIMTFLTAVNTAIYISGI